MTESIKVFEVLTNDCERIFSAEREAAIAAGGFEAGSYSILVDENRRFEGIAVKPDMRIVSLSELVDLIARSA